MRPPAVISVKLVLTFRLIFLNIHYGGLCPDTRVSMIINVCRNFYTTFERKTPVVQIN